MATLRTWILTVGILTGGAIVLAQPAIDTMAVARQVNDAYVGLRDGSLQVEDLAAFILKVDGAVVDEEQLGWALEVFRLRSTRYIDIHQSMSLRRVIRTPLPPPLAPLASVDEAEWLPLLEAAASGRPVELPDGTLTRSNETYLLAVVAAWAQYEVFSAVERHLGVQTPMSAALRLVGPTLAWIEPMMAEPPDMVAIEAMAVARRFAGSLPDWSSDGLNELLDAFDRAPAAVISMLQYDVLRELVDVDATLAIAVHVLHRTDVADVAHHSERLRYLGMTGITLVAVEEAISIRTVPTHLIAAGAPLEPALIDDLVEYRQRLASATSVILDLIHRDDVGD